MMKFQNSIKIEYYLEYMFESNVKISNIKITVQGTGISI